MINEGGFLTGPAMRSVAGAIGTPRTTRACSISTTTGPTTRTTTSASADPRYNRPGAGIASEGLHLGRGTPGDSSPKARQSAQPKTAAGPTGAAAERGSDFHHLTTLDHLYRCLSKARASKGRALRVQRFSNDELRHLITIQARLRSRTFAFGPYRVFTVQEKKFRDVVDAPMKDRIVHWMLYDYMLPIWQPRFISDTFGNLPGRGTHAAVNRLADFCRSDGAGWVLQMDISKYFYSVPHEQLKARALRYIGDHDIRALIINLVDSYSIDSRYDHLFAPDSLYRKTPAKGMPIGNLTSQLLANIFLCDFDHWVKQTLQIGRYIRYVDDIVIVGRSAEELRTISGQITAKLALDGLTMHPRKVRIAPVRAGVPFLGHIVWPNHISAGNYTLSRYHQRLRQHEAGYRDRTEALQSYRAMFQHNGSTRFKQSREE